MTFFERERDGRERELPPGTVVRLTGVVINKHSATRDAHIVDPDTLRIEHHMAGQPEIHGGWPIVREFSESEVNNNKFWKESGPSPRIIWKPANNQ